MTTAKENYLKTIYDLIIKGQPVQVSQIAANLSITRASVSRMIKELEQEGLIKHKRYGSVLLTIEGLKIAETIANRNQLIQDFLVHVLGLDHEIAIKEACKIEHTISHITTMRLADYLQTLKNGNSY